MLSKHIVKSLLHLDFTAPEECLLEEISQFGIFVRVGAAPSAMEAAREWAFYIPAPGS